MSLRGLSWAPGPVICKAGDVFCLSHGDMIINTQGVSAYNHPTVFAYIILPQRIQIFYTNVCDNKTKRLPDTLRP